MLNRTSPGFVAFEPAWTAFLSHHERWFHARLLEGNDVYFVPICEDTGFARTFALAPKEIAAESAFAATCRDFKIIGVRLNTDRDLRFNAELIHYEGVQAPEEDPDTSWLELGRIVGWSDEMIVNARIALTKADDLQLRVTSAAGRLLCSREFLRERDALKANWESLPTSEQLPMPLRPIVRVTGQSAVTAAWKVSGPTVEFVDSFEKFCNKWETNGFESWDLPIPRGPFWPDCRSTQTPGSCQATMRFETPWHFAALESDGLGTIAMEQLRAAQERHGIDDQSSWRTYAQLFRLCFWETILRRRYVDRSRPRDFIRQLKGLLADLLNVSLERVDKLRKLQSGLKSGRLRSLARIR
jgi:hypothetical protein